MVGGLTGPRHQDSWNLPAPGNNKPTTPSSPPSPPPPPCALASALERNARRFGHITSTTLPPCCGPLPLGPKLAARPDLSVFDFTPVSHRRPANFPKHPPPEAPITLPLPQSGPGSFRPGRQLLDPVSGSLEFVSGRTRFWATRGRARNLDDKVGLRGRVPGIARWAEAEKWRWVSCSLRVGPILGKRGDKWCEGLNNGAETVLRVSPTRTDEIEYGNVRWGPRHLSDCAGPPTGRHECRVAFFGPGPPGRTGEKPREVPPRRDNSSRGGILHFPLALRSGWRIMDAINSGRSSRADRRCLGTSMLSQIAPPTYFHLPGAFATAGAYSVH
ncbi:hypothetical protein H6P81_011219 [Aristolochia fimbriata]|uniref:Uncharacterized protein n=1 Tax=Aristolochia fimbriata TaxID=158543 RepID=A0AAV7ES59_ARIFI|nr:hypothetical protein H6P81_011219 [Aristolochia fimbriata]